MIRKVRVDARESIDVRLRVKWIFHIFRPSSTFIEAPATNRRDTPELGPNCVKRHQQLREGWVGAIVREVHEKNIFFALATLFFLPDRSRVSE